jgi:sulfur-carrier protein
MKILYFAWLRERIGTASEELQLPENIKDVDGLVEHLKSQGDGYSHAFEEPSLIKVAVNQDFAKGTTTVSNSDEVAFFPPVTGG